MSNVIATPDDGLAVGVSTILVSRNQTATGVAHGSHKPYTINSGTTLVAGSMVVTDGSKVWTQAFPSSAEWVPFKRTT